MQQQPLPQMMMAPSMPSMPRAHAVPVMSVAPEAPIMTMTPSMPSMPNARPVPVTRSEVPRLAMSPSSPDSPFSHVVMAVPQPQRMTLPAVLPNKGSRIMMPQVPRSMMPQVPESNFFTKIMPKQMQPHVSVPGLDFCDGRQPEEKVQMPGNRNKFVVCHLGGTFDIMHCPKHLVFNIHTRHCENSHRKPKGCSVDPCKNGAKCVDLPFHQFQCECPQGFQGRLCQNHETCSRSDCGAQGVCMQFPKGSPVDHYCVCDEGLSYGLTCNHRQVDRNPCVENDADLHSFPTPVDPTLFLQCEGHIPHLKFCAHPLVYSHELQRCDWEL